MKQTKRQRRRSAQRLRVRAHFGIKSSVPKRYRGLLWHIWNDTHVHNVDSFSGFTSAQIMEAMQRFTQQPPLPVKLDFESIMKTDIDEPNPDFDFRTLEIKLPTNFTTL